MDCISAIDMNYFWVARLTNILILHDICSVFLANSLNQHFSFFLFSFGKWENKMPYCKVEQIWNINSINGEVFGSFSLITIQLPEAHSDAQRPTSDLHPAQLLWAAGQLSHQPPGIRGQCPYALGKLWACRKSHSDLWAINVHTAETVPVSLRVFVLPMRNVCQINLFFLLFLYANNLNFFGVTSKQTWCRANG